MTQGKSLFEVDAKDVTTTWDSKKVTTIFGSWQLEMTNEEAWSLGKLWCEITRGAVEKAHESSRADEAREKISSLRMPREEDAPPFEPRHNFLSRRGEDLTPHTTTAPIPIVGGKCPDCGYEVKEDDPRRQPDPDSPQVFRWVHSECLRKRGIEK